MATYQEFAPPQVLSQAVACFWAAAEAGVPPSSNRVLPDGCIDIVLKISPGFGNRVWLIGAMTRAHIPGETGPTSYLGLRFKPGGAYSVLGPGLHELTDSRLRLQERFPELEGWLLEAAEASCGDALNMCDFMAGVSRFIASISYGPDRRIAYACTRMVQSHGQISQNELAREMGLSRQFLGRLFHSQVGLTPKHFARIQRLQKVIAVSNQIIPDWGWAGVAQECGYVDQSHLIADFKSLAGTTPARFFQKDGSV